LPVALDIDDLVQVGLVSAIRAARRYDESGGASLDTYVGTCARGAMLDEIRRFDPVRRTVRKRLRDAEGATRRIESCVLRKVRPAEVATALGIELDTLERAKVDAAAGIDIRFEDWDEDECSLLDTLASDSLGPAGLAETEEECAALNEAMEALPARERELLDLYYRRDMMLREIGARWDLTESRVCQLHKAAVAMMRTQLQAAA
jgi:RNA polymerase sigma factor for flagellar operon FliA